MRKRNRKSIDKKERRLKKRHLVFIAMVALFCDIVYSYTQNAKLIFIIVVILIAFSLVAHLGTKIETGKGSDSPNIYG